MKLVDKKDIKRFQEGGQMTGAPLPAPEQAPALGAEDPMAQILGAFQEAVETQNCELCMQAAQALLEVVAQGQGGGGQPEAPVYQKCGGKMVKKNKKSKK